MAKMMRVQDIAEELGVSVPTAYRVVRDLQSVKQGRYRTFDADIAKSTYLQKDSTRKRKQQEEPVDFVEMGSAAFQRRGERVVEERLRQLRGREGRILLREIRLNDPVIAAVFLAIENAIRRVTWRVKAASESLADLEVAEFIENCLFEDQSFTWTDTMQFILNFLEQGFSLTELVYKRRLGPNPPSYISDAAPSLFDDGRIGWRKWAPRPAESLAPGREWVIDEHGGIQGIRQDTGDKRGTVEIPIDRLLLFRTTVAPANSPEGLAIHRAAFVPWHMSNQLQEVEGIGIERDLAGLPVVYMGSDTRKRGSNNDFEQAKDIVTNLRIDEQAGVVFPYPKLGLGGENRGILLELLTSPGRHSFNTSAIIERYNRQKALSMLAMFIILGMENVGSYALGRLQADIFVLAVSAFATNIAETINRFAIPRLLRYNVFPGMTTTKLPKLVPSDVGIPNLEEMAIYVNTLVGAGLLKPDQELEKHLRQIAHLPQKEDVIAGAEQEDTTDTPMANDRQILRAARAGLILNRLRLLQQQGQLTGIEAQRLMTAARNELLDALGVEASTAGPLPEPPPPQEEEEEK